MSYMVRNPGLIPGFESLRKGDVGKKQKMVAEVGLFSGIMYFFNKS